jgi:ribosomal protein S18 acetylase RimI-like enzyme
MQIKLRKATKKDFEKYNNLNQEMLKEYSKIIGKKIKLSSLNESKKIFANVLNDKNNYLLLAEMDNKIIGYIFGSVCESVCSKKGYIEDIFVKKSERGKEVASQLIKEFIKILKEKKMGKISLSVNIKNKVALSLYKKRGFKIIKYEMEKKLK